MKKKYISLKLNNTFLNKHQGNNQPKTEIRIKCFRLGLDITNLILINNTTLI